MFGERTAITQKNQGSHAQIYEPARGRCNWKKWFVWAWRLEVPRGTAGFNIGFLNLPHQAVGRTAILSAIDIVAAYRGVCLLSWSKAIHTAQARISELNLFVVLPVMTPVYLRSGTSSKPGAVNTASRGWLELRGQIH